MPTPATRTRISISPSSGEASFIRHLPPKAPEPSDRRFIALGNVFDFVKPSPEKPRRVHGRPSILTVASPESVSLDPAAASVDQFLDECCFCQKRMPLNSDVFMYGLFGAFCSEVCRFQQIYKDKVAEQAVAKAARTAINGTKSSVNTWFRMAIIFLRLACAFGGYSCK